MDLYDEILREYTFNGAVSMKAIQDDIVTLENQLETYKEKLDEIRLRGKDSSSLVSKIRETKINLSRLKAVFKRENEKGKSNSDIIDMLGVSANSANEIETPDTAASQKPPLAEDFVEVEAEPIEKAADIYSTVNIETKKEEEGNVVPVDRQDTVNDYKVVQHNDESPVDIISMENEDEHDVTNTSCILDETEEPDTNNIPPPTMEDYPELFSEVPGNDYEKYAECDFYPVQYCKEEMEPEPTVAHLEKKSAESDFSIYKSFAYCEGEIFSFLDLSNFSSTRKAEMVSTSIDYIRKLLTVKFFDADDYDMFVDLLKYFNEGRNNIFDVFLKKTQSIFMYVTVINKNESKNYKYEFSGCQINDFNYSEYFSHDVCDEPFYECTVTFKYKTLKIT